MGVKQQPSDQSTDPKKRRRVGFSNIDAGIEAKDCIEIFLVSSKEEVGALDSFLIDPADLNQFFDEDGKIYGYQELKISIWVSSISFHAYADIAYQSSSDVSNGVQLPLMGDKDRFMGGKGITDLKSALQRIFAETLVETKDDFLQTFSAESQYIRSIVSSGEILQHKPFKGHRNDCNSNMGVESSDLEAIRMVLGDMTAGHFYSRLIPLVLLLVDGSSPIDVTDSRWEMYLLVQKNTDQLGDSQYRLLGFAAVYRFYHYPNTSRLRLSQILVLPPYQHKGYGRWLLELLNNVSIAENVYDVTVEEPLEYFQHVRTCVDALRLIYFEPIQQALTAAVLRLKQERLSKKTQSLPLMPPSAAVEDVRRVLKINKKQFLQCWEVLIYLGLDPVEKFMENFVTFISDRVRADIIGKDSGTAGKQVIEVSSDYDPEVSFVMFRSGAGDNDSIQIDENQSNQEEQLKQLVDERVNEIKLVAQKVCLHRS